MESKIYKNRSSLLYSMLLGMVLFVVSSDARSEQLTELDEDLFHAVFTNNIEQVEHYIKEGANVNAFFDASYVSEYTDWDWDAGLNPLHIARNYHIAKLLLDAGADIEATTSDGYTPLMMVLRPNIWRYWLRYVDDLSEDKQRALIQLFIDYGVDVNAIRRDGETALHLVQSLSIAELLIDHGADVNIGNDRVTSPFQRATVAQDLAFVELLLRHGAKDGFPWPKDK